MFTGVHIFKARALGLEVMAQWSRTLIALSEDQSLEPSHQIGQLKKASNSSSKVSVFLLASVGACVQAHTHIHTHTVKETDTPKKKSRNPLIRVPFWEIRSHLEDDFGHRYWSGIKDHALPVRKREHRPWHKVGVSMNPYTCHSLFCHYGPCRLFCQHFCSYWCPYDGFARTSLPERITIFNFTDFLPYLLRDLESRKEFFVQICVGEA